MSTLGGKGDHSIFCAKFNGSGDGLEWMNGFVRYLKYRGSIGADDAVIDADKHRIMMLLVMLLQGPAASWYEDLAAGEKDTWANLQAAFLKRFKEQNVLRLKYSRQMFSTKQNPGEKLLDFALRIQTIARKTADEPSEDLIIRAVLGGAKPHVATYLADRNPTTVAELITAAALAEATVGVTDFASSAQLDAQFDAFRQEISEQFTKQFTKLNVSLSTGEMASEEAAQAVSFATPVEVAQTGQERRHESRSPARNGQQQANA